MSRLVKLKFTPLAAVLAGACISGTAVAQDAGFTLEEIIVTARKTEESLQDVSLSITAFTSDDIAARSIEDANDIALYTPGLTFEDYSNGGFSTPTIRGGAQFNLDGLEQNVSTFVDGVYIPRQWAINVGVNGIDRIEVVKGPQSALYGANAFLGAINYVSAKPDLEEFSGEVGLTLGDGGRQDIEGVFSIPIVQDRLAVKFVGSLSEYDGDITNEHPLASQAPRRGTDEDFNGWDNETFSVTLLAQPTDNFSFELGYTNYKKLTEVSPQTRLSRFDGDFNCGASVFGFLGAVCGELPSTPIAPGSGADPVEAPLAIDPRSYSEVDTEVLRAAFTLNLSENASLRYQYGGVEADVFSSGGNERNPVLGGGDGTINLSFLPFGNIDYDTHELKFEYNTDGGIYAMLGVFALDGEDLDVFNAVDAPIGELDPILAPDPAAGFFPPSVIETDTTAVFGRVSVPLADAFTLAVEARFTDTEIEQADTTETYDDTFFTPRVNLDYNLTDDSLIFFSAAKGVKSGGINAPVIREGGFGTPFVPLPPGEEVFGPDENITYEIGTKNTLLDGRLVVNATAFLIDWSDLQVTTATTDPAANDTTGNITTNLGSATSQGIEADLTFLATESLTFNAGLALIDATYDSGVISQRIIRAGICDDVVCPTDGDIGGNDLPRSSDVQWNIGVQYDVTLGGSGMDLFLRADLVGQSEQYVSELNLAEVPDRTLLNLRGGISDDRWSAEVWVRNATDEDYVSNAFYISSPFFINYVSSFGPERRVGLTLDYSF